MRGGEGGCRAAGPPHCGQGTVPKGCGGRGAAGWGPTSAARSSRCRALLVQASFSICGASLERLEIGTGEALAQGSTAIPTLYQRTPRKCYRHDILRRTHRIPSVLRPPQCQALGSVSGKYMSGY